jgi:N-acetylneuraminic acid mutarotase
MASRVRLVFLLGLVSLVVIPLHAGQILASGHWTMTAHMANARHQHMMVLLTDGTVLVAGGMKGAIPLSSSEIYDPHVRRWSPSGSLNVGRAAASGVLLPSGKVLLAGGCVSACDQPTGVTELYDPETGSWSQTGSLNVPRYFHTSTLLANGQVLVTGGCDSKNCATETASAEIYDPGTRTWSLTAPLTDARYRHTATLLADGEVLITGGHDSTKVLASTELYDPSTGGWIQVGDLGAPRYLHTATLLPDGTVMAVGGRGGDFGAMLCSTEVFDPSIGTWTYSQTIGKMVQEHTATLLRDGMVLVAGGTGVVTINGEVVFGSKVRSRLYSPHTKHWLPTERLERARTEHSAVVLSDGDVLVSGGINSKGNDIDTAELYRVGK